MTQQFDATTRWVNDPAYMPKNFQPLLFMKNIVAIAALLLILSPGANAGQLCFSPVKEKQGDRSSKRSWRQSFDYRVQVDNGPVVKPATESSTPYAFSSSEPLVKIWLGDRTVESFRVSRGWLAQGRNCVYFKNLYETWSVVEVWQAKRLCSCS